MNRYAVTMRRTASARGLQISSIAVSIIESLLSCGNRPVDRCDKSIDPTFRRGQCCLPARITHRQPLGVYEFDLFNANKLQKLAHEARFEVQRGAGIFAAARS